MPSLREKSARHGNILHPVRQTGGTKTSTKEMPEVRNGKPL
jgi:hypothetical protein